MAERPHLLAIPLPVQGHLNPMLQLCNRLSSRGLLITFLVPLKSEFITNLKHQDASNLRFMFLPDEFIPAQFIHSDNPMQFFTIYQENLRSALPLIIQKIESDPQLPRLTCMLTDVLIVGFEDFCSQFGLYKASLSTSPASWHLVQHSFELMHDKNLLPLRGSGKAIDFIPGLPVMLGCDFPALIQEDDPFDPGFKIRKQRNSTVRRTNAWVLVNSFHELESSQLEQLAKTDPNFVPVGPLVPLSAFAGVDATDDQRPSQMLGFWSEDLSCMEWLDQQLNKSVIYVSVGSIAVMSSDQISEVHKGLKQSGKKFLWVMRSDTCQLDNNDEVGKIVSWAPQLKVLKHPAVAAFLTHCGWNSMLEAVVTGTPVLCWPLLFDQPMNCVLAVDHWKIGLRLPKPCSAGDVQECAQLVTGDARFRENASRLSVAAKETVLDQGGGSSRNLRAFVDDMNK